MLQPSSTILNTILTILHTLLNTTLYYTLLYSAILQTTALQAARGSLQGYNPHVRYAAAMALGIACAGTALLEDSWSWQDFGSRVFEV